MHNERLCAYCHAKPYKAVWSMSKGGGAPLKPSKSRGNKLGLQAVVIERLFFVNLPLWAMEQKADLSEVASFDASKLKHVKTVEKNTLPSSESKTKTIVVPYVICTTQEFGLLPLNEIKRIFVNISVLHYLT